MCWAASFEAVIIKLGRMGTGFLCGELGHCWYLSFTGGLFVPGTSNGASDWLQMYIMQLLSGLSSSTSVQGVM